MSIDLLAISSGGIFLLGAGPAVCDYPDEGNVRVGVEYGEGSLTGTLGAITPGDSPATQVKDLLAGAGVGIFGTDLFVGFEPEKPHACIVCYDSGGHEPQAKLALDYPRVQVTIRGAVFDYSGAWNKAKQVKDVLLGIDPIEEIGGITMPAEMGYIGVDELKRPAFSLNFQLSMAPTGIGNRISTV